MQEHCYGRQVSDPPGQLPYQIQVSLFFGSSCCYGMSSMGNLAATGSSPSPSTLSRNDKLALSKGGQETNIMRPGESRQMELACSEGGDCVKK